MTSNGAKTGTTPSGTRQQSHSPDPYWRPRPRRRACPRAAATPLRAGPRRAARHGAPRARRAAYSRVPRCAPANADAKDAFGATDRRVRPSDGSYRPNRKRRRGSINGGCALADVCKGTVLQCVAPWRTCSCGRSSLASGLTPHAVGTSDGTLPVAAPSAPNAARSISRALCCALRCTASATVSACCAAASRACSRSCSETFCSAVGAERAQQRCLLERQQAPSRCVSVLVCVPVCVCVRARVCARAGVCVSVFACAHDVCACKCVRVRALT